MVQFPEQHFSVIILSNTGSLDLVAVSQKIADLYLDRMFKAPPPTTPSSTIRKADANPRTPLTPDEIHDYVGNYFSNELNIVYQVLEKDGNLIVRYSLGDYPLEHVISDAFVGTFPISELQFIRNQDGKCNGFVINDNRARNIRFDKVSFAK